MWYVAECALWLSVEVVITFEYLYEEVEYILNQ